MESRDSFNASGNTSSPPHSPWHSPVPYLFGGLAAMLGLIAFALLILACSYWKLSAFLESGGEEEDRDLETGEGKGDDDQKGGREQTVMEQKFLVIMAGDAKPTFLATPMSSSFSRPCSKSEKCCCSDRFEAGEGEKQHPPSSQNQGNQSH